MPPERPSSTRDRLTAHPSIISVEGVSKVYPSGFEALKGIDLTIRRGEIFALLGPNGAGKTTLINVIGGIVKATSGSVTADGRDIVTDFRGARARIGLVPQELATDMFEKVIDTVGFSRGLFGKPKDPAHLEKVLRDLALWEKRNEKIMTLSGGMKRRVLIAKALAHEPTILFLDEPTAGVDVELRRDMWEMIRSLRERGVTIILTTHYIEEAEQMADRVAVIDKGRIVLVEEKTTLMKRLGQKQVLFRLREALEEIPSSLDGWHLESIDGGRGLVLSVRAGEHEPLSKLLARFVELGLEIDDLETRETSLEEIFVKLVKR